MYRLLHQIKKMKNKISILAVIFVLVYVFNAHILKFIYPLAHTVHSEFVKYYDTRNSIYAIAFFCGILFMFYNTKGIVKALMTFGVFVSFASVIDKVFYNFYQFKHTDWLIIGIGALAGIYIYYYDRKNRTI